MSAVQLVVAGPQPLDVADDRLSQAHAILDLLFTVVAEKQADALCSHSLTSALHSAMLRIQEAQEAVWQVRPGKQGGRGAMITKGRCWNTRPAWGTMQDIEELQRAASNQRERGPYAESVRAFREAINARHGAAIASSSNASAVGVAS